MRFTTLVICFVSAHNIMGMESECVEMLRPSSPPKQAQRARSMSLNVDADCAGIMRPSSPSPVRSHYALSRQYRPLPGNRSEQVAYIYWGTAFMPTLIALGKNYVQLQENGLIVNIAGFFSALSAIRKNSIQLIKKYRETRKRFEQKPEVINFINDQLRECLTEYLNRVMGEIDIFFDTPARLDLAQREHKPWLEPLGNFYEYLLHVPLDD